MKYPLKTILKYYLKIITRLVLFVRRPTVIAVAGSINKHFVKIEIKRVLEKAGKSVRANNKSFNTEIGLPLAILELESGYNSYKNWWPAIKAAPGRIFKKDFPEYLVLELGASDPGDMKYLLSLAKPKIAVITDITQRYLESFSDMEELVKEYKYLAGKLTSADTLVLNYDNQRVRSLEKFTKARTISYSVEGKADYYAREIIRKGPAQQFIFQSRAGESQTVTQGRFGTHHIYSFLTGEIIKNYATR